MDEQPDVTIKLDADKLAKTKLRVIRKLSKDMDWDKVYEFLAPIMEGGEEALDNLELWQLNSLFEQVKVEIDKLGNRGN